MRLWAAVVDYQEDQRIGKTILQTTIDAAIAERSQVFGRIKAKGGDICPTTDRTILKLRAVRLCTIFD